MLVNVVRLMLGLEFVVNGLNWWVKLIDPYPSISDFVAHAPPPDVVGAMIRTGILFHLVKATELAAGLALLCNRFVPLALVAALPVTVNVFVVDVMLSTHLRAHIMGSGALLMQGFLMLAYLPCYRPMLAARLPPNATLGAQTPPPVRRAMTVIGTAATAIGAVMLGWVAVMIVQHFTHA